MAQQQLILVIDDEAPIRLMVADALQAEGHPVVTAEHGAAALELLRATVPCLILLDMRMPVMDGWTFARTYRGQPGPHAPIVVMTAARSAQAWAKEVGAAGVLAKPFGLDDLLGLVAEHGAGQRP